MVAHMQKATSLRDCEGYPHPYSTICAGYVASHIARRLQESEPAFKSPCIRWTFLEKWAEFLRGTPPDQLINSERLKIPTWVSDWDILHPFVSCPGEQRYGWVGDGGKWTCRPIRDADAKKAFKDGKCLVYSFGVNDQPSYEHELVQALGCKIHAFDFTPGLQSPFDTQYKDKIHFHRWGLLAEDGTISLRGEDVQGYSLDTIMDKLGHKGKTLDILKIDIEGSEWGFLERLVPVAGSKEGKGLDALPFKQFQMELHAEPHNIFIWPVVRAIVGLLEAGFLPFHKELNAYHPGHLTEVAFVNVNWLVESEPACKP